MHIINTFYIAKDGDGSQFEYKEEPTWSEIDQLYDGEYLHKHDFGYDIDTQDLLSAGDVVKATLSLTFCEQPTAKELTPYPMSDIADDKLRQRRENIARSKE